VMEGGLLAGLRSADDLFGEIFDGHGLTEPPGPRDRGLDPGERALEAAEGRREEADPLVQRRELASEAARRPEIDDLHGRRPVDPVETPDPLLDGRRIRREVEQDETPAELEVASLAPRLRRDENRRSVRAPELGHLDVAALGRELFVEDRDALARGGLQPRLEGGQRRALVDEDESLRRAVL